MLEFFRVIVIILKAFEFFWRLSTWSLKTLKSLEFLKASKSEAVASKTLKVFSVCVCVWGVCIMRMRVCTLVGVCRWPYPLPYIYTPAQTFSKGFGVSTSLPHRPLKPQILKKAHRPLKRVPRRWGIYMYLGGYKYYYKGIFQFCQWNITKNR